MHVDAGNADSGQAGCQSIDFLGLFPGNAEFVLFFAGRDFGMGLGIHIGIDAEGYRCGFAKGDCTG